jgi:hypothetical protein
MMFRIFGVAHSGADPEQCGHRCDEDGPVRHGFRWEPGIFRGVSAIQRVMIEAR